MKWGCLTEEYDPSLEHNVVNKEEGKKASVAIKGDKIDEESEQSK